MRFFEIAKNSLCGQKFLINKNTFLSYLNQCFSHLFLTEPRATNFWKVKRHQSSCLLRLDALKAPNIPMQMCVHKFEFMTSSVSCFDIGL